MSVTKRPILNVLIGILILASLVTMWIPCYEANGDSASLMGYISSPSNHKGITAMFEELHEGFILNGQVWIPLINLLIGVSALVVMILKRNLTSSLILPGVFSIVGILNCWINPLNAQAA